MGFDLSFMTVALKAGISAVPLTTALSGGAFAVSFLCGTVFALVRLNNVPYLSKLLQIYITVIKAVPAILLLYIVYFLIVDGFNAFSEALRLNVTSKNISMNVIAVIALSLNGTVTVSETIRGAFLSVPRGQYEGAYSVGLTGYQTLKRVVLPQMIPVAVPVLCNNLIVFIKMSALLYYISVTDILNAAQIPATINYKFLESYVAAALIYWAICVAIEKLSKLLERKLSRYRDK
ncbi:amino acid ABC transporter permease [Treponema endosymbiont of Eucomonympha sp.]|uniref:amino acid ABC transporter permease n=1 Tax=Treponema endosymbiont of Eucomonympha sp. TaxID=1580831 RepID=UPI0007812760|nr:amino acid ABC transporter permease [Treponema endosymbiont of Eucomonympha sp.]